MPRVEISVDGMTCEHCETTVTAALQGAGATEALADFRRGRASADFDGDPSVLVDAIRQAGYAAGPIETGTSEAALVVASSSDGDYDLAEIGSGGAAFGAAIRATNLGARVVVIERGTVGGTCVNVGCVPSKTLLAGADAFHTAASHPFAGLPTHAGHADVAAIVAQKDELVGQLRQAKYIDVAAAYGFDIVHGQARFVDPDTLEVDGRPLRARSYLVATGAEPKIPDLPGLAQSGYLTSTTAMELTELPARVITIGGGFVGMDRASSSPAWAPGSASSGGWPPGPSRSWRRGWTVSSRDVVILTGEVSSTRAKRAAGDDAWDTPGVVDVSNQLVVAT